MSKYLESLRTSLMDPLPIDLTEIYIKNKDLFEDAIKFGFNLQYQYRFSWVETKGKWWRKAKLKKVLNYIIILSKTTQNINNFYNVTLEFELHPYASETFCCANLGIALLDYDNLSRNRTNSVSVSSINSILYVLGRLNIPDEWVLDRNGKIEMILGS